MLQQLKFLTVLWTPLKNFTCIETLWVGIKSNIMLYSSIGNSCSVWECSYTPATSTASQFFSSLHLHTGGKTGNWLTSVLLCALILTLLHQHKLPLYLYLVSPLEDQKKLQKAPLLALFRKRMIFSPCNFLIFKSWSPLETHDTITSPSYLCLYLGFLCSGFPSEL